MHHLRDLMADIRNRDTDYESIYEPEFWQNAATTLLKFIDETRNKPEQINAMTPKEYSDENACILLTLFTVLRHFQEPNRPFDYTPSVENSNSDGNHDLSDPDAPYEMLSLYELMYSRFMSWICQLLGDRFNYVQKLLIKTIYDDSEICSLMASDIYIFIMRIVHPNQRMPMCQLIMNLNKLAPPSAFTRGASLINRIKHPIVNFENPKYQYLLNF